MTLIQEITLEKTQFWTKKFLITLLERTLFIGLSYIIKTSRKRPLNGLNQKLKYLDQTRNPLLKRKLVELNKETKELQISITEVGLMEQDLENSTFL